METLSISGVGGSSDRDLRSLFEWLRKDLAIGRQLSLAEQTAVPDTMGATLAAIEVALSSGGVSTALVSGIFAWLNSRSRPTMIKVRRSDGLSVTLSAETVRAVKLSEISERVAEVVSALDAATPRDDTAQRASEPRDSRRAKGSES
jgi:hypothetical protein